MKSKIFLATCLIMIGITEINICKGQALKGKDQDQKMRSIGIFNFHNNQDLIKFNELNLDESYPNLLNPEISKSDFNAVIKSWTDFHQEIGNYLLENKFSWEVEDKTISIVQKIYFAPDGKIEYFFFKVLSENVTTEKKERFAQLLSDFAMTNQINFKLEKSFAQCGKTKYLNK